MTDQPAGTGEPPNDAWRAPAAKRLRPGAAFEVQRGETVQQAYERTWRERPELREP